MIIEFNILSLSKCHFLLNKLCCTVRLAMGDIQPNLELSIDSKEIHIKIHALLGHRFVPSLAPAVPYTKYYHHNHKQGNE